MNLRQSDADLRLQMQQIDDAAPPAGARPPNPFAATLGIGVVVALIWLLFSLGPIIRQVVALGRDGADLALSLLCPSCVAPETADSPPGRIGFAPHGLRTKPPITAPHGSR